VRQCAPVRPAADAACEHDADTIAGTSITARKMVICGSKAISRDTSQFTPTANVATLTEP